MATNNPFEITYNSTAIGGNSDTYQLLGPYVLDKSYRTFRLIFDVIVVATNASTLRSLSDTLETKFRERDKNLQIDTGSTVWTWTAGTHYFNPVSSIAKSGDSETDRGFSRAYTISIEAELPADASGENGLLEIKTNCGYDASRQKTVTIEGSYTATSGNTSKANYTSNADTKCNSILSALDGTATFELIEEDFDYDRNTANTNFVRQYIELLFNESISSLKDTDIKDHRVVFTDLSQHPADSRENTQRLRRVVGAYECAIDIDQTTDLQSAFTDKVKPLVLQTFKSNFNPTVFCLEDRRISYDETTKRLSASLQFLYQKDGGEAVVEISQSVAYREQRTIDYTPVHSSSNETSAYADPGWATIERVWTRTVVVLGDQTPQRRIGGKTARYNEAGDFDAVGNIRIEGTDKIVESGWNIISNVSQVSDRWVGDPTNEEQIKLTSLTETVVERYNDKPQSGGSSGPTTPR
tara:strand:+ start:2508 stop:3911 length:1404 start_codon:yes stop_codon:yes gene_type:complete